MIPSLLFSIALAVPVSALAQAAMHRVLPVQVARDIADRALNACQARGYKMAVTVVDRAGLPLAVLRDAEASPLTLEASRRKAYTALTFYRSSAEVARLLQANPEAAPLAQFDGVIALGGGLPIISGGQQVGAVGVAGAPGGEIDEGCARTATDGAALSLK